MDVETEWLRVRGMGRERFAGHLSEYLTGIGYSVDRTESTDPPETHLLAKLVRMNPAIPSAGAELRFRLYPTSGGAAVGWVAPQVVPDAERGRFDRMVREIFAHLERAVLTESHATAKVSRPPDIRLPWESAR
ncbi:MAG TPA: hypothetical protein VGS23_05140 [Thermoplasmata archaeon]|nr:hypothetical protein [Thermoplasmata archaeon]